MKQENKIFGILAIILGAIALLGSWIPGINQISFLIAILALILGIVGLCINRKNDIKHENKTISSPNFRNFISNCFSLHYTMPPFRKWNW